MKKEANKNASTTTGVSANLVLIVPFIILKMTVNTSWLVITAVKVHAQNVTDKFVNSGIVKKDVSEKQIVNISMKTQKLMKVKPGRH